MNIRKLVSHRPVRAAIIAIAVVIAASGIAHATYLGSGGLPDDAVLAMGDTVVTVDDLESRILVLEAVYGLAAPEEAEERREFERNAAKSMAVSLVLERVARREGVVISQKAAQSELTKMIETELDGDRERFISYLGQRGVTERAVLDEIVRTMATSQLYDEVTGGIAEVTPEEAREHFAENREEMVSPERRSLANIVVESEEDAQEVVRRIRAGEDFADVAADASLDAATKDDAGVLGELSRADLESDFADAAFATDKPGIFGPVESQHGWNIGRVVEIIAEEKLDYDDIKDELPVKLTQERLAQAWSEWLEKELSDAQIKYADDYRPKDPDTAPTESVTPR